MTLLTSTRAVAWAYVALAGLTAPNDGNGGGRPVDFELNGRLSFSDIDFSIALTCVQISISLFVFYRRSSARTVPYVHRACESSFYVKIILVNMSFFILRPVCSSDSTVCSYVCVLDNFWLYFLRWNSDIYEQPGSLSDPSYQLEFRHRRRFKMDQSAFSTLFYRLTYLFARNHTAGSCSFTKISHEYTFLHADLRTEIFKLYSLSIARACV